MAQKRWRRAAMNRDYDSPKNTIWRGRKEYRQLVRSAGAQEKVTVRQGVKCSEVLELHISEYRHTSSTAVLKLKTFLNK